MFKDLAIFNVIIKCRKNYSIYCIYFTKYNILNTCFLFSDHVLYSLENIIVLAAEHRLRNIIAPFLSLFSDIFEEK